MKKLAKIYRLVNILSIDVAAGATISAAFFGYFFHIKIHSACLLLMGLTVWIIYTADHLIDAARTSAPAATIRHRFHQLHFRAILFFWGVGMVVGVISLLFVNREVLVAGVVLSVAVAIYFLVQRRLKYVKELSGSILYCAGILLPVWSVRVWHLTPSQLLLLAQFAGIVWSNMLLFSIFDRDRDLRDHHHSFVTVVGERKANILLIVILTSDLVLAATQLILRINDAVPLVTLLVMNLILFMILVGRSRFARHEGFRLLGDAIFLIPAIALIL